MVRDVFRIPVPHCTFQPWVLGAEHVSNPGSVFTRSFCAILFNDEVNLPLYVCMHVCIVFFFFFFSSFSFSFRPLKTRYIHSFSFRPGLSRQFGERADAALRHQRGDVRFTSNRVHHAHGQSQGWSAFALQSCAGTRRADFYRCFWSIFKTAVPHKRTSTVAWGCTVPACAFFLQGRFLKGRFNTE